MAHSDQLTKYYLGEALQAMEQAHANNMDNNVGPHISRAIGALHELIYRVADSRFVSGGMVSDRYEINDSNSAV